MDFNRGKEYSPQLFNNHLSTSNLPFHSSIIINKCQDSILSPLNITIHLTLTIKTPRPNNILPKLSKNNPLNLSTLLREYKVAPPILQVPPISHPPPPTTNPLSIPSIPLKTLLSSVKTFNLV